MTTPTRALFAGSPRWYVRALPWALAVALCASLLPTTVVVLSGWGLGVGLAGALAVAQTAPLLLAVTRPLLAWYVVLAADVVGALLLLGVDGTAVWPFPPMEIVGYVALCLALGLREPRRTLLAVWLATAVVALGLASLAPDGTGGSAVVVTALSGVALLLGRVVRERQDAQRALVEQETISEAEREQRTLLEERARIARELHDVVAHHMSVITVQADTAAYRQEGLSPQVREEFTSIAATARESLGEMRRLLGVLRADESRADRTPQPGLAQIGHLVEATRRAGVPVDLTTCDIEVPEALGLSAYRIVQEALANVVRHAPGAPTRVCVSGEDGVLSVVVANAAAPGPAPDPLEKAGTGQGLVGMRERVRLVGGTLSAGPSDDGGFRVAATLPLAGGEPA